MRLRSPTCAAYAHRLRLVFQGTWIRHCGWYRGSWVVRLVDRRHAKFDSGPVGERACVDGPVGRLHNDIVDDDRKGLAAWLHKHVRYAELEAQRRASTAPMSQRLHTLRARHNTRPLIRAVLKDLIFPVVPAKPVALFLYMYMPARRPRRPGRTALLLLPCLVRGQRCGTADGRREMLFVVRRAP